MKWITQQLKLPTAVTISDVIMVAMASQITGVSIVYSNPLFKCRSKKTSKPRVTGLCEGTSPGTGEFPAQRASNAERVSIWWRHHAQPDANSGNWFCWAKANWQVFSWIPRNKLQWNIIQNTYISSQEARLKMSSAKFRPFCLYSPVQMLCAVL